MIPPFALKTEDVKPKKSGRKWRFDYNEGRFEATVWGDTEEQCRQKVINFFGLGPKATVERMDDEIPRYVVTLEDGYRQVFYLEATNEKLIARCRTMRELKVKPKTSDW